MALALAFVMLTMNTAIVALVLAAPAGSKPAEVPPQPAVMPADAHRTMSATPGTVEISITAGQASQVAVLSLYTAGCSHSDSADESGSLDIVLCRQSGAAGQASFDVVLTRGPERVRMSGWTALRHAATVVAASHLGKDEVLVSLRQR
jgi:hypothetical protein